MGTTDTMTATEAAQAWAQGLAGIDALVADGLPKEGAAALERRLMAAIYFSSQAAREWMNAKLWELQQQRNA